MINDSQIGNQVLDGWIVDLSREVEKQEDYDARGLFGSALRPVVKLSIPEAKALIDLLKKSQEIEKAVEQISLFWTNLDEPPNARAVDWTYQAVIRWRFNRSGE